MALLLGSLNAPTVCEQFSPFEMGQVPKSFPVVALTNIWQGDGSDRWQHFEFARYAQTNAVLIVCFSSNELGGKGLLAVSAKNTVSFDVVGSPIAGVDAYEVDLNGDNIKDYVIRTESGGCGLAGEVSFSTFLLSSQTGYVAHCILGFDSEATDFVDIDKDEKPEYVHTMFVYGEDGADGKTHNYWVYNLLGFSGTNILSANSRDARFPKWVRYKFKPNHQDTEQLTAEQRKRLWLKAWDWEAKSFGKPMFPHPEAFADEQGKPKKTSNVRAEAYNARTGCGI